MIRATGGKQDGAHGIEQRVRSMGRISRLTEHLGGQLWLHAAHRAHHDPLAHRNSYNDWNDHGHECVSAGNAHVSVNVLPRLRYGDTLLRGKRSPRARPNVMARSRNYAAGLASSKAKLLRASRFCVPIKPMRPELSEPNLATPMTTSPTCSK